MDTKKPTQQRVAWVRSWKLSWLSGTATWRRSHGAISNFLRA